MTGTATALSGYTYPTAVSWGYPHLEVFTNSKAHTNYWKYRGMNTSDTIWHPTDGSLATFGGVDADFDTSLSAISRKKGDVDVFLTSNDSSRHTTYAWHTSHTSRGFDLSAGQAPWDGPNPQDTSFATGLAQVGDENRLDAFALGTNGDLSQISWNSSVGWKSVFPLGGHWAMFVPTAVSWGDGRIDVFVVDSDSKQLYHTYYDNGTWQPATKFESLGGYCTSRPTAVSWASGRIDVFVRGGDAGLWHLSFNGTWSIWTSISGNMSVQGELEALSWGENRLDVFAWGSDQSLLHKSFDGAKAQWTPLENFEVLGHDLGGPPKGVVDAPGSLHVFCFSRFGALQHTWWNQTTGVWGPSPAGTFEQLGIPPGGI
jgi:hypothetical protein